jgi:hypothetical protein
MPEIRDTTEKSAVWKLAPRRPGVIGGIGLTCNPFGKRRVLALAAPLLLAACSPEYNWRELDVAGGEVRAAFPARVQTETRNVALAGASLPFTLASAQVDSNYFAVGSAAVPAALLQDAAGRERLGQALMRSLYGNLGVAPPDPLPAFGATLEVQGKGGDDRWSLAKVWVTADAVIEVVALGSRPALPRERAEEFLRQANLRTAP